MRCDLGVGELVNLQDRSMSLRAISSITSVCTYVYVYSSVYIYIYMSACNGCCGPGSVQSQTVTRCHAWRSTPKCRYVIMRSTGQFKIRTLLKKIVFNLHINIFIRRIQSKRNTLICDLSLISEILFLSHHLLYIICAFIIFSDITSKIC